MEQWLILKNFSSRDVLVQIENTMSDCLIFETVDGLGKTALLSQFMLKGAEKGDKVILPSQFKVRR